MYSGVLSGLTHAKKFARENSGLNDKFSLSIQPGGRGSNAFVAIHKTRDYFHKKTLRFHPIQDEFSKIKVPVPELKEQIAIVEILDKATEELNQYQQKLETLQLQKKGLMQQLLTGKTRVKI